jgi:hypothetical protein
MNQENHQRANDLLKRRRCEPLSQEDERWLAAHLALCHSCAAGDAQIDQALAALRTLPIEVPKNLASRTQLRVRMRAEELREHGTANRLIWAVALMSWIFGLASAPLVWRGFSWLGSELHLPKAVWVAGVALWWVIPALVATGVVLLAHKGQTGAADR